MVMGLSREEVRLGYGAARKQDLTEGQTKITLSDLRLCQSGRVDGTARKQQFAKSPGTRRGACGHASGGTHHLARLA
jgi:hypothetical protein